MRRFVVDSLCEYATQVFPYEIAVLLASIYFKISFLREEGLVLVRRFLTESGTLADYLPLFASDIFTAFLYFPLLLLPLLLLQRNVRPYAVFVLVELLFVYAIIAKVVYGELGRFPSAGLVVDFLQAYRTDPAILELPSQSTLQLVKYTLVLLAGAVALGTSLFLSRRHPRCMVHPLLAGATGVLLMTALAARAAVPIWTNYHYGYGEYLAKELLASRAEELFPELKHADARRIHSYYLDTVYPVRQAVAAQETPSGAAGVSYARPQGVIWVVLETAASIDYPLDDPARMPNIAALVPHALLARRHYSSAGYSIRADFSLYTSINDGPGEQWLAHSLSDSHAVLDGALPRLLADAGYSTHFYFPGQFLWESEQRMVSSAGFSHISAEDGEGTAFMRLAQPERVAKEDRMFQRAGKDLERLCKGQEPYFMVVRSMIGHAPFFDPLNMSGSASEDRPAIISGLNRYLDARVGTLLGILRDCSALQSTAILVTGDHGIRSAGEYPGFDGRFLDERTFHVPFLLYYEPAFPAAREVDFITSHIDVAPTQLALCGLGVDDSMQGSSMLDPSIRDRLSLFTSTDLGASVGLHYRGRYFMYDRSSGLRFISDRFGFDEHNLVTDENPESRFFSVSLTRLEQVRQAWLGMKLRQSVASAGE